MESDGHKGFCVKSLKTAVKEVEITTLENFDLSEALENVYPLLEIVLSYLNFNDLKTCCLVKNTWKDVAESILNKRNTASWFTCYKTKGKPRRNVLKHSDNLNSNNVGLGIFIYDYRRIKLNKYICVHTNTTDLSRKSVPEYLEDEIVPKCVDYCVISCPKVDSYLDLSKDTKDLGLGSILDGIFIPNIPKVRTAMFHSNPVKIENIGASIDMHIKPYEDVKCILMFCTAILNNSIYNVLKHLIPEGFSASERAALGGGIIRGTKIFQRVNPAKKVFSSYDTFCIVFLEDRSCKADFDAYSYVIHGDDLSKGEFEDELDKFKNKILLRRNGVAIKICCSAKVDPEEELVLFNKVFPNIPLLGLTADGEIGWNSFGTSAENRTGESKPKKSKQKYPKAHHQWSTIIVLLTWGVPIC